MEPLLISLAADDQDGNEFDLKKLANFFKFFQFL